MGYQLIEEITVGAGGAASIEFTGIPQDGVDLVLVFSGRSTYAVVIDNAVLTFNSSSLNLLARSLRGNGSSVGSDALSGGTAMRLLNSGASATSNTFGSSQIYIPNYASSNPKSASIDAVSENNGTESGQYLWATLWNDSAPITSIQLTTSLVQYSTASLYMITAD